MPSLSGNAEAGIEPESTKIESGTYSDYWCLRGASRTFALVTL